MIIEKVLYQKLFPTGMFANEKVGIELIVEHGEDAKDVLAYGKKIVNEFHFENNKELYEQRGTQVLDFDDPNYVKKPMDIIVKGWYDKAVKDGDTKTIELLSKEFIVE